MEVKDPRLRYLPVHSADEALDYLKRAQVDPQGIQSMLPKMVHVNLLLEGIESRMAETIRQELLFVGADAVVTWTTAGQGPDGVDVILTGTLRQIRSFAERIAAQPFGMERLAERIGGIIGDVFCPSPHLRTSRREIRLGERTLIMGILNVTPDSFSDGGRFTSPERAVEEGIRMAGQGADIIDIGGESTRPGSESVSVDEELERVIPVVRGLAGKIDVPLSIDTMKGAVAREALREGAEIVNDVSSMGFDPAMAETVAEAGAALVLMHMRGMPKTMQTGNLTYPSLWGEVIGFLQERIQKAEAAGVDTGKIAVDPGLGFGKTAQDNLRLIRELEELKVLGRPILIGPSRKAFVGHVTGAGVGERMEGTAAVVTAAILNGSRIVRVHDVAAMKKVSLMADALARA
jgi:dihydropteroate synthase